MVLAGEPSGDSMAAGLVHALRAECRHSNRLEFFGVGGVRMRDAGVELIEDMTRHSVFGLVEVARHYFRFRAIFRMLLELAGARRPDLIILVDYAGFNLRFAEAVRKLSSCNQFNKASAWKPRIVYYVSPQVWASRATRVFALSRSVDCVLSLFPFEKPWYAMRAPFLRVEFVGDPMADKYRSVFRATEVVTTKRPLVLLLPGSRRQELNRHIPVMTRTMAMIEERLDCRFLMILADDEQANAAQGLLPEGHSVQIRTGGLSEALAEACLTLACSGTVTRECGYHGVPTIVFYRLSYLTYCLARILIQVKYIAMPNLLLNRLVYPELIQSRATPENISALALEFLTHPSLRQDTRKALEQLIESMGKPGAFDRAARVVREYLPNPPDSN
jgi:lipid-A-disaccharide synthase